MFRAIAGASLIGLLGGTAALVHHAPEIAAGAVLYPSRSTKVPAAPDGCVNRDFRGDGVTLRGWACAASTGRTGTIVYLHGIADNRGSGAGAVRRYLARGYDVVAFDSRAHGESGGEICTYGFHEKDDLRSVIDTLPEGPVALIGTSLGAAVALQAAADDPRISAVVAAETFSDLEAAVRERAPFFVWEGLLRDAFAIAEQRGRFIVAAVSPETAARSVRVPVLLVHGERDSDTPPAHSRRVFEALAGRRRLLLVPGAAHNQSLQAPDTWAEIDGWIETAMRGSS